MNKSTDHYILIEAGRFESHYWRDLFAFRELLYFLAWRDILVRYKQTVIGLAWSILRPLTTLAIFTFVFGRIAALPSEGSAYPLLVYAALLPWQFFASMLTDCSNSLLGNSSMISKIYFPRLIIPASSIAVSLVDFLISFVLLLCLMAWFHVFPTWRFIYLPAFLFLAIAAAFGAGVWFAALTIKYRDFRYIVPFLVQIGLYISPVGFSSGLVPEKWRLLYSLNPMVAVIDGFRWAILGEDTFFYWPGFLVSVLLIAVLIFSGISYFRKTEKTFADLI